MAVAGELHEEKGKGFNPLGNERSKLAIEGILTLHRSVLKIGGS